MRINATIEENRYVLQLLNKNERVIDFLCWSDKMNLSRVFLKKIIRLTKKNRVPLDKIREYKIIASVPLSYTSYRIIKATFEGIKSALKFFN